MISEEEFNEWRQHPMTKELMRVLGMKREEMRQNWEGGVFTDYEPTAMALISVGNIGTCKGYAYVQDFDYTQYMTEIEDMEREDDVN